MIRLVLLLVLMSANLVHAHQPVHIEAQEVPAAPGPTVDTAPATGNGSAVKIRFLDGAGQQTPAMFSLALTDSWQQVSLQQEFLPNALHPRRYSQRRQWRGKYPIHSSGESTLRLAEGRYTLTAGKGLEFSRIKVDFEVVAGQALTLDVPLRRWIDMPALGWWSGDPHVHVARLDAGSDRDILAAAMAEDIHLTSTLEMGDADEMYFPVHARGPFGHSRKGDYWLAAGQEEPRTNELGHSIFLNTSQLFRDQERYYLYDQVFAQARAEGAVAGLAHYYFAKFHTYRAGALLFPEGLVDFVELLDNSDVFSPEQYYDALNLGFQVPVSAGSDYPWGEHIGDQRTYVKLQEQQKLTPQAWYLGLKAGRSFVTQGPIIQFNINGQDIGSVLNLSRGDVLKIEAQAQAPPYIGAPKQLRLISMGTVLADVSRADRSAQPLTLTHTATVTQSRWYVVMATSHNGAVAHSSPIYVHVDNQPARLQGPEFVTLVEKQLAVLHGAGVDRIPQRHRSAAYALWLRRIEAYYRSLIQYDVAE